MMDTLKKKFLQDSKEKATDLDHRRKMNFSLHQSDLAFEKGIAKLPNLDQLRKHAKNRKWEVIEHLDTYLLQFEEQFTRRGGKLIWAENVEQALEAVMTICRQKNARSIVKSKSMVTEEIHLNAHLSENGIEVVETDLGEFIQQLAGEAPYHLVAPSLHKSREDVARLFHEKLDAPEGLAPEELTLFARKVLREQYVQADIGITGANFLLADIGGVAVTENEGNARLSTSFPGTHIVITGIEKILPSVHDLALFWPLLASHGSGQDITVYNTVFTGPRKAGEVDGPEDMYVILLDNGRSEILADTKARESLFCIRCGACFNVCPVYRNIGGHAYDTTYGGPIGSVITPYLRGPAYSHLSHASSLCGACTQVCPVRINIHELLLYNRNRSVVQGGAGRLEKAGWYGWMKICLSRKLMDAVGGGIKNRMLAGVFRKSWGDNRSLPRFAPRSFSRLWKDAGRPVRPRRS